MAREHPPPPSFSQSKDQNLYGGEVSSWVNDFRWDFKQHTRMDFNGKSQTITDIRIVYGILSFHKDLLKMKFAEHDLIMTSSK